MRHCHWERLDMTRKFSFRGTSKVEQIINDYMTDHNVTQTQALNQLIERPQSERILSPAEQWHKIGCPALLEIPEKGGYHCANKAPRIVLIPNLVICQFCWARQQTQKATTAQPTTSSLYKKPEKIYCIRDTIHIDPLKLQAKCALCLKEKPYVWGECQQKQRLAADTWRNREVCKWSLDWSASPKVTPHSQTSATPLT